MSRNPKNLPQSVTIQLSANVVTGENKLLFHIQDSGVGMTEEEAVHALQRSYKVDEARSSLSGGMGLGLSISKEIILAHQGDITVKSTENVSSTFTIHLPIKYD